MSDAREKIETIASLRLLDEACTWNNLAFFKHIDEGERDVAATTGARRSLLNPINK